VVLEQRLIGISGRRRQFTEAGSTFQPK